MGEPTFCACQFHGPAFLLILIQEKIRLHMERLIPDADWMGDTVPELEANSFNPVIRPCCDANNFRLHLEGTTCNPWNSSATEVFVEDFLSHHPEYPREVDSVRDMVLLKTRATITSMIKEYRKLKLNSDELDDLQLRKNRAERKRGVSEPSRPRGVELMILSSSSVDVWISPIFILPSSPVAPC